MSHAADGPRNASGLRVVIISQYVSAFRGLYDACVVGGQVPVALVCVRSERSCGPVTPAFSAQVQRLVAEVPADLDVVVPCGKRSLEAALARYAPDLLLCRGFPWLLPAPVLRVPQLGAVNVHPSLLPRYRGPLPVHWAIRNGDGELGATVHWMDEGFDTGRIIAQGSVELGEDEIGPDIWAKVDRLVASLLPAALADIGAGRPGREQDESQATYAGFMEPEFAYVDWSQPRRAIHDQVRVWAFGLDGVVQGPIAQLGERRVRLLRTSLVPGSGQAIECGDGPLWVLRTAPAF